MKLSLGTVQFGVDYGICNHTGLVKKNEIIKMLELFRSNGFENFDTASTYGISETVLSDLLDDRVMITTKVPPNDSDIPLPVWINKNLESSLNNLKRSSVESLLLHRPSDAFNVDKSELNFRISQLKEQKKIKNFGLSVYRCEELSQAIKLLDVDVVQLPFNLIDRRFLQSGWFDRLTALGIKIEVRSIFLQGLLLVGVEKLPTGFDKWFYLWEVFEEWKKKNKNCSALDACLSFVTSFPQIDSVVVGAQDTEQLKAVVKGFKSRNYLKFPNISCGDYNLVLPQNWGKL